VVHITWWLSLGAGVLSFLSPCCLPLYPSYLSYITGISIAQYNGISPSKGVRRLFLFHTLFFILGFSVVFYALGFTFSWIGHFFSYYKHIIRMVGAILLFIMGLFLIGIFQPTFLLKERKFINISKKKWGYFGSLCIGMSFAAGWTPCLGPVLSAVLYIAAYKPALAFANITAYSLGFAIPFFVFSFFVGQAKWILKYSEKVMIWGGICMVFFAIVLYTNQMVTITSWFSRLIGGFRGFGL
jgi:cytochrome c-type biogenesis protein